MDDVTPQTLSSLMRVTRRHNGTIIPPSDRDINIMHWNINHLTNKMNEVEVCRTSYPGTLHIIAITETWLTIDNRHAFKLLNYTEFHNVRANSEGGGISIFVHDSLCDTIPKILVDLVTPSRNHFLVLQIPDINYTIAVPYRRGSINEFIDEF